MALAIAFEGCGCRAAFHVGAVEFLESQGVRWRVVTGASSGSLIAAAVALERTGELRAAWSTLLGSRVFDVKRTLRGHWPFRMSEIVGEIATRHFGALRVCDTTIPLAVPVTQLRGTRFVRRTITSRDDVPLAAAVRASCFIPGPYSRMVCIDRHLTFDGAWMGRVPIDEARLLGADKVIACVSDDAGRLLRGAVRAIAVPPPGGIEYSVLSPIERLPVGTFDFDAARTDASFDIGRRSAEAFFERERRWLEP
jgi:predicted acylesterase/phospholipase RssA